jgi:hypothetical protein
MHILDLPRILAGRPFNRLLETKSFEILELDRIIEAEKAEREIRDQLLR